MAHTTNINKTAFIHNGDFSGDVTIVREEVRMQVTVPVEDLVSFVVTRLKEAKIAYLEDVSDQEFLENYIKT